ncbi:MAG: L-dopachrome tautomerase-related protein [Planctomycetota bacterium]
MSIARRYQTGWLNRGTRGAMAGLLALGASVGLGCSSNETIVEGSFAGADGGVYRVVETFGRETPTAVAISGRGRTFVGFAGGGERGVKLVELTAHDGAAPYPSASWNDWKGKAGANALRSLIDVRGVWIDTSETLWVLDSGSSEGRVVPGGPKLMRVDLAGDEVTEVFYLPTGDEIGPWSEMSDVRVDGKRRVAYFLDAQRGRVVVYELDARQAWSVPMTQPQRLAGSGGALEIAGMGDWLYVSDPVGGALRVAPTSVLRASQQKDVLEDGVTQRLAETGGAVEGLWLDGDGRLFMLRPSDGTLLVRGTDRKVRAAIRDGVLKRGRRVAADHRGRLFVTIAPASTGWGRVDGPREGALIELTSGRAQARVSDVVAPMTLGPTWPRPKDLLRRTDRLDELAERDARPMADEGVAPAALAEHPPPGISDHQLQADAPTNLRATYPIHYPTKATKLEASGFDERPKFGRERREFDDSIKLPTVRHELNESGKLRAKAVAGVPNE